MYCIKCGNKVMQDDKFCNICGEKIQKEEVKDIPQSITNQPVLKEKPIKNSNAGIYIVISIIFSVVIITWVYNKFNNSNDKVINDMVTYLKTEWDLPTEIDEYTVLVDVTPQANAIRYHYIVSGLGDLSLTSSDLKSFLLPSACNDSDIMDLLREGINLEYSYVCDDSLNTYFFVISEDDCI